MTIKESITRRTIDTYNGYSIKSYLNEIAKRWCVYLPVNCGLRERFSKREGRMLLSHYVYCRANKIKGISNARS